MHKSDQNSAKYRHHQYHCYYFSHFSFVFSGRQEAGKVRRAGSFLSPASLWWRGRRWGRVCTWPSERTLSWWVSQRLWAGQAGKKRVISERPFFLFMKANVFFFRKRLTWVMTCVCVRACVRECMYVCMSGWLHAYTPVPMSLCVFMCVFTH